MNKWQKHFIGTYYDGKKPRDAVGKFKFDLLGKVKDEVTVHYPDETETFEITLEDADCDMPSGIISVNVLASNLYLWASRGYTIETKQRSVIE